MYRAFELYHEYKKSHFLFDEADVVFNIYTRLNQVRCVVVSAIQGWQIWVLRGPEWVKSETFEDYFSEHILA